jgi:hypothetical protein
MTTEELYDRIRLFFTAWDEADGALAPTIHAVESFRRDMIEAGIVPARDPVVMLRRLDDLREKRS